MGAYSKRFQKGTILATGLETSFVMFWQIMARFCSCAKNLPEDKLKGFGLISLAEKASTQPGTGTVMLLSVLTLRQVYNEEEQVDKKKHEMHNSRRKRTPRNLTGVQVCAKRDKERSGMKWNKWSDTFI